MVSLVKEGKFTGRVLQRELVLITHLFTLDNILLLGGEPGKRGEVHWQGATEGAVLITHLFTLDSFLLLGGEPGEGGEVHWQGAAEGAGTHHPPLHP